jgi:hypothetical protein
MEYNDFLENFSTIYYCNLIPNNYIINTFKGTWNEKNRGGDIIYSRFFLNDQYQILVKNKKTKFILNLHQPGKNHFF